MKQINRTFPALLTKILPIKQAISGRDFSTDSDLVRKNNEIAKNSENNASVNIEEIRIPMPWGYVAGKWWGPKDVRPIVSLHGWQDNAGTFDRLIPLLPNEISYLALDLPGHGLSSYLPNGMNYDLKNTVYMLRCLKKQYQWDKVSIMGHSLGSHIGFLYSSIFSNEVDLMIGIDGLKPFVSNLEKNIANLENKINSFHLYDLRNQNKIEPHAYSYEEITKLIVNGEYTSITRELTPYLLKRGAKPSSKDPNLYILTRDSRIKHGFLGITFPQNFAEAFIKRIHCPYLFIKASDSPYFEEKKYFDQSIRLFKENNPKFQLHYIKGEHHLHLTDPTRISKILSEFMLKYRLPHIKSKL